MYLQYSRPVEPTITWLLRYDATSWQSHDSVCLRLASLFSQNFTKWPNLWSLFLAKLVKLFFQTFLLCFHFFSSSLFQWNWGLRSSCQPHQKINLFIALSRASCSPQRVSFGEVAGLFRSDFLFVCCHPLRVIFALSRASCYSQRVFYGEVGGLLCLDILLVYCRLCITKGVSSFSLACIFERVCCDELL